MPSGGPRVGAPGVSYPNRTDLNTQPVRTATGQPYGQAGQQRAAQQAAPLPQAPDFGDMLAPSARPEEPATAGAALGAGPGPAEAGIGQADNRDDVTAWLQGVYRAYPTDDLRDLLEAMMAGDHDPGGRYGPPMFG